MVFVLVHHKAGLIPTMAFTLAKFPCKNLCYFVLWCCLLMCYCLSFRYEDMSSNDYKLVKILSFETQLIPPPQLCVIPYL